MTPKVLKVGKRLRPMVLLVLFGSLAAIFHQSAVSLPKNDTGADGAADLGYLPSQRMAKLTTLGHHWTLADLYWIKAVLYSVDELEGGGSFRWTADFGNVIVGLDPDFYEVYTWVASMTFIRGAAKQEVTVESLRQANRLIDKGIVRFPNDWKLALSGLANCSYYFEAKTEADKSFVSDCRKKYLHIAANKPGAPSSLHNMLLKETDDPAAAEAVCNLMAESLLLGGDPELRRQATGQMRSGVCSAHTPESLKAEQRKFSVAYAPYNYIHSDLRPHLMTPQHPIN